MNRNSNSRNPLSALFRNIPINRGMAFGVIIITALLSFEIFNYGTTEYALTDLLGELRFAGLRWATILSIAFCGIDFAGIARLFTPDGRSPQRNEVWYLFGAWMLAATMNAMLTWWGVSLAILDHQTLGNAVINRNTLLRVVPIFVAILVWLIRVLIIGTFSVAGDRLFEIGEVQARNDHRLSNQLGASNPVRSLTRPPVSTPVHTLTPRPSSAASLRSALNSAPNRQSFSSPRTQSNENESSYSRPEPTYQPLNLSASESSAPSQSEPVDSFPARKPLNIRR